MFRIVFCLIVSGFAGTLLCSDNQGFRVCIQDSVTQSDEFFFKKSELPSVKQVLHDAGVKYSFMHSGSLRTKHPIDHKLVSIFAFVSQKDIAALSEQLRLVTTKPLRQS